MANGGTNYTMNINNNLVGSLTTANSINNNSTSTTAIVHNLVGIYTFTSNNVYNITNNTVANLNSSATAATTGGSLV